MCLICQNFSSNILISGIVVDVRSIHQINFQPSLFYIILPIFVPSKLPTIRYITIHWEWLTIYLIKTHCDISLLFFISLFFWSHALLIQGDCQWRTMCRHNIMINFNLTFFFFRHSKHQMKFTANKTSYMICNFRLVMCVHLVVKIIEFITCQE